MFNRIKKLRKSLGLTQTEFANKLKMSLGGIQRWERVGSDSNDIKLSSIRLIEDTFNVNPDWLREGKGEMFQHEPRSNNEYDPEEYALLQNTIAMIDRVFSKYEVDFDSDVKARFILQMFRFAKAANVELTEKIVVDMLKGA